MDFLQHTLPGDGTQPRIVVLDHASPHTSRTIKAAHEALKKKNIRLWYLPPTAPN